MSSKIRVQLEDDSIIWKFLIEPEWKNMKEFEKYMKSIFKLDKIVLLDDDGYLHPESKINYLYCMSENNEILTIRNVIEASHDSETQKIKQKKMKCKSNTKKRKNENEDISDNNLNNVDVIHKKIYNNLNIPIIEDVQNVEIVKSHNLAVDLDTTNEIQCKNSKKRKRKRKTSVVNENTDLPTLNQDKVEMMNKKIKIKNVINSNVKNPFKDKTFNSLENSTSSKHFYFDELDKNSKDANEEKNSKVIFVDCLEKEDLEKPRIFKSLIVRFDDKMGNVVFNDNNSKINEPEIIVSEDIETELFNNIIGPKFPDDLIKRKNVKWESLLDAENLEILDDKMLLKDNSNLCNEKNSKIIIISNEIISNGINNII